MKFYDLGGYVQLQIPIKMSIAVTQMFTSSIKSIWWYN